MPAGLPGINGKVEGRKSHLEARPEVVAVAKRLHRASPKTGERRSLRKIAAELATLGHLNVTHRSRLVAPARHAAAGSLSSLTWLQGGEQPGSIMLVAQQDGVRLRYRHGSPVDVNELVPFAYTATRFGGRQQWLGCLKCGRGCRKIYDGRYFAAVCATACDTPRRAKNRISAPRTELARLPNAWAS